MRVLCSGMPRYLNYGYYYLFIQFGCKIIESYKVSDFLMLYYVLYYTYINTSSMYAIIMFLKNAFYFFSQNIFL